MQNFFPVGFFKTAHISTLFVTKKNIKQDIFHNFMRSKNESWIYVLTKIFFCYVNVNNNPFSEKKSGFIDSGFVAHKLTMKKY